MTVIAGKSPLTMDAVGDQWPVLGSAERLPLKISNIRVVTGAGTGTVELLDVIGGRQIFLRIGMLANDVDTVTLAGGEGWYSEVYVAQLPTGAKVFLYYE